MWMQAYLAVVCLAIGGYCVNEAIEESRERRRGRGVVFGTLGIALIALGAFLLWPRIAKWLDRWAAR